MARFILNLRNGDYRVLGKRLILILVRIVKVMAVTDIKTRITIKTTLAVTAFCGVDVGSVAEGNVEDEAVVVGVGELGGMGVADEGGYVG